MEHLDECPLNEPFTVSILVQSFCPARAGTGQFSGVVGQSSFES